LFSRLFAFVAGFKRLAFVAGFKLLAFISGLRTYFSGAIFAKLPIILAVADEEPPAQLATAKRH